MYSPHRSRRLRSGRALTLSSSASISPPLSLPSLTDSSMDTYPFRFLLFPSLPLICHDLSYLPVLEPERASTGNLSSVRRDLGTRSSTSTSSIPLSPCHRRPPPPFQPPPGWMSSSHASSSAFPLSSLEQLVQRVVPELAPPPSGSALDADEDDDRLDRLDELVAYASEVLAA